VSILEARKAWAALSPREQTFARSPVAEGEAPPAEWIRQLQGIARYDVLANAAIATLSRVLVGMLLSWFLLLFAAMNGFVPLPGMVLIAAVLAWTALLGAVAVYRQSWKSADVPDVLAHTLLPFLRVLALELPADAPVHIKLDLLASDRLALLIDEVESGSMRTKLCRDRIFRHPWLTLATTMGNGSVLDLRVEDTLRVRKQTRRRGGKQKTKTKIKTRRRIRARLTVRPDRGLIGTQSVDVQLRETDKRHQLRSEVREQGVESLFVTEPIVLIRLVARCFAHTRQAA